MNKKLVVRVLGVLFLLTQFVNFFYLINFRDALLKNSLTIDGKTVLYTDYNTLQNFFWFEVIIFFISLIIVASIIDLANKI